MESLAKQIKQLLEETEASEEINVDEIADWAMEDEECDDIDEDCEEMDEGCGSKHKSDDDDDDDDDDEMDEDVQGISEEKMKNMAGLNFEIIDMRGEKGFPEDDKGLVYAHRTNEPLNDKYTGIAKNWKRTFAIRTDASGRKGWRIDLMGAFGGPAEAIEGLRGYYKTPMAAAKKLAAYLKSVYQKGVYLESMDVDGGSEELFESFKLQKSDIVVINAFLDKKSASSKRLSTDGKSLDIVGMGGRGVVVWGPKHIVFQDVGTRSAQTVQRMVKKIAPKNLWIDEDVDGGAEELDEGMDPDEKWDSMIRSIGADLAQIQRYDSVGMRKVSVKLLTKKIRSMQKRFDHMISWLKE